MYTTQSSGLSVILCIRVQYTIVILVTTFLYIICTIFLVKPKNPRESQRPLFFCWNWLIKLDKERVKNCTNYPPICRCRP